MTLPNWGLSNLPKEECHFCGAESAGACYIKSYKKIRLCQDCGVKLAKILNSLGANIIITADGEPQFYPGKGD